jgi:hypothetical protein
MDVRSTVGSPERVHPGTGQYEPAVHGLAGSILSLSRVEGSDRKSLDKVLFERPSGGQFVRF